MKQFFQWALLLCLGVAVMPATAQDKEAETIIKRYEQVTGMDKLTSVEMECAMTEVTAKVQGAEMSMKIIVKQPDKMRMEMNVLGQQILVVMSGDQGWINAPGQGIQQMTPEMMAQMKEQIASINRGYMLDKNATFKMADEVTEEGKTYQGVQMIMNEPTPEVKNMVVYFDKESGKMSHMLIDVEQGGQTMAARMNVGGYKTFGELSIPTEISMSMMGISVMDMTITNIEYGYSATDELFSM